MKIDVAYGRDLDDITLAQLLCMEADAFACYESIDAKHGECILCAIPTETTKHFKRRMANTMFLMKFMPSMHSKKRSLVGIACLAKMGKKCLCLHTVYIKPTFRRKGIGEAIVKKAIAEAKKQRCSLVLGVNPLNAQAIALYKKLGFQVCKEQKLHMELNLKG